MKKETSVGMSLAAGALACVICLVCPFLSKAQAVSSDVQNLVKAPSPKDVHPATDKTPKREPVGEEAHPEVAAVPEGIDLKTYRIGIEDDLMISVWREPELSNQVVVRPDGKITMPLLNDIQVAGMRTEELQNLLTEKLKPFVNSPQVTVIVRGIRSRKVYLVGNVGHQGTFTLNDEKTVLELIAEAGGLGPFAKSGSIYILREAGGGKKVRIGFDYKKAIAGTGPNPVLQPGDLVVVR